MKRAIPISAALLGSVLALAGSAVIAPASSLAAESAAAKAPGKADYEKALAEAKTAQKKAASVDGEWRDVGKLIKDGEAAAAKGDYATAIKHLSMAKFQGYEGYAQAIGQKSAGNPPYLK
jgi:hypothetical protein